MRRFGIFIFILLGSISCHCKPHSGVEGEAPAALPSEGATRAPVTERSWPIMGTVFSIQIWNQEPAMASQAMEEAFQRIVDVDRKMSTYRSDSEISNINRQAGETESVSVSTETMEVITAGLARGKDSEGTFDITIGPLVALWTFYSPWKGEKRRPPPEKEILKAQKLLGLDHVWNDPTRHLVRLKKPGMKLDFGGIAKGYALDRAAQALEKWKIKSALLDLGGQILVLGHPPEGKEWKIGIRDPDHSGQMLGTVSIDQGSLATSGGYERFFIHQGKRYSHILNPRTGWPVNDTKAVTVWAPTGLMADGWSTALFVAGYEKGKELMKHQPELKALWLDSTGTHNEHLSLAF